MGRFDVGSFIGGMIIGGIAGAVFVGYNALKLGTGLFQTASNEGWLNQAEMERDLQRMKGSGMAMAYAGRKVRRRRRRGRIGTRPPYGRAIGYRRKRANAARAIYGHGSGIESDLNRIPIYL